MCSVCPNRSNKAITSAIMFDAARITTSAIRRCVILSWIHLTTELPYRIEHWNIKGQYNRPVCFFDEICQKYVIVKCTHNEQSNAELLWSSMTGKRHDCVFEAEWSEDSAASRALGWWRKQHFVNEDRCRAKDEKVWVKASFATRVNQIMTKLIQYNS